MIVGSRRLWTSVTFWFVVVCSATLQGQIALYDAGPAGGGPTDLDPVLQGWLAEEVNDGSVVPADQNVFFLQPDGTTGFNATQLFDQHGNTPTDNPTYRLNLTTTDFEQMFSFGWIYESRFRPVEGGGFGGWGMSAANAAIFGISGRERFGIAPAIDTADNSATVNLFDGPTFNLGPNSADSYHTVKAVGIAGTSEYEFFIDDLSEGTYNLDVSGSNSGSDDRILFSSGSSGGTGRVVNWNLVSLDVGDTPALPEFVIDRDSGSITLTNNTGSPVDMLGYSILSDFGALNASDWLSIADNYDAGNPGPDQVDPDNNWTILAGNTGEIAEMELEGGNGAVLANGQSIDLGTPWIRQYNEELAAELLLTDGSVIRPIIAYTGNDDEPYLFGDIAGGTDGGPDGTVDVADWNAFKAGFGSDLTGLSAAEAYLASDFNDDGLSTLIDYRLFEIAYDDVNGAGAFARLVPEPSTVGLCALALLLTIPLRKRLAGLAVRTGTWLPLIACLLLFVSQTVRAETVLALYDAGPAGGGPADLDPVLQGWNADEVNDGSSDPADQNVFFLQPDGTTGFNATQLNDQHGGTPTDNPRYNIELTPKSFEDMFFFGWEVELRYRPIATGNFGLGFGAPASNPWNPGTQERVGFGVNHVDTDNSFQISQIGGTTFNLGPNSADSYHLIRAEGQPQSSNYDLYIDDVFQETVDFTAGSSNTASDNFTGFQSGSSGGVNRVGNWNYFKLSIDTPDPLTLTVNTTTGAATISNEFADSLEVDAYDITSGSMALNPGGWSPLEDNPAYGNGVPDDGIGWEILTGSSSQMAEANLTGFSTFDPSDSVSIGNVFSPGAARDLVFTMTLEDAGVLAGIVEYVEPTVDGDFNDDLKWDCADIDALVAEIVAGTDDPAFDMNGDGEVTAADITDADVGWLAVGGSQNPIATGGNPYLEGDANLDGSVDVSDFNIWNGNKFTPTAAWCEGDFTADGSVDVSDFNIWNGKKFTSSMGGGDVVPEPTSLLLLGMGVAGAWGVMRRRTRGLANMLTIMLASALVMASFSASVSADAFVDRLYEFGDDSFENGSAGAVIGANVPTPFDDGRTLDSAGVGGGTGDLKDLFLARDDMGVILPNNDPTYVDTFASGRPGATSGQLGARFDGVGDGLTGRELNSPNDTWFDLWTENNSYPRNWTGIFNRGIQLWVRPESSDNPGTTPGIGGGTRQDVVTDTGEHGIFISENDNWGLQFDDVGVESEVAAVADEWAHVMQRTLNGAQGGALLVNGIAVAARGTTYDPEDGDMSVGANQDASGNYYKGAADEMKMFLWGDNSGITPGAGEPPGADWGDLDLNEDNDWIAMQLADLGVTDPADVNLDGAVNQTDVDVFVPNWRNTQLVMDVPVGDWNSRQNGDLNYDGFIDFNDAFILHFGLMAATGEGLDFSLLPEPSAGLLALVCGLASLVPLRRRQQS